MPTSHSVGQAPTLVGETGSAITSIITGKATQRFAIPYSLRLRELSKEEQPGTTPSTAPYAAHLAAEARVRRPSQSTKIFPLFPALFAGGLYTASTGERRTGTPFSGVTMELPGITGRSVVMLTGYINDKGQLVPVIASLNAEANIYQDPTTTISDPHNDPRTWTVPDPGDVIPHTESEIPTHWRVNIDEEGNPTQVILVNPGDRTGRIPETCPPDYEPIETIPEVKKGGSSPIILHGGEPGNPKKEKKPRKKGSEGESEVKNKDEVIIKSRKSGLPPSYTAIWNGGWGKGNTAAELGKILKVYLLPGQVVPFYIFANGQVAPILLELSLPEGCGRSTGPAQVGLYKDNNGNVVLTVDVEIEKSDGTFTLNDPFTVHMNPPINEQAYLVPEVFGGQTSLINAAIAEIPNSPFMQAIS